MHSHIKKGSVLIEVVVVAAILSAVSLAFLGTFAALSQFHEKDSMLIKGQLLAEEGIEALRFIKGAGWQALYDIPRDRETYLDLSPASWGVSTTPEYVDGVFKRSFRVSDVYRDASDKITNNGGVLDPGTLLLRSKVEWQYKNSTSSASFEAYITEI